MDLLQDQVALDYAHASSDERARGWCGSLYNNLGWTYHGQGDDECALDSFQKALAWQQEQGKARARLIARLE
ncbi:MAG TPA: tetratricopeptide repeat protein [Ktedonobacteraceae bacterium]|nr:tetratricopeptide repeat protein [Ktedonobacteraceae bacterium]